MKGPPKSRPRGGRVSPPRDGLVGRSEACRILGCEGRQFRRFVEEGIVPVAAVDHYADGRVQARWFDVTVLRDLATKVGRWKRQGRRRARKLASATRAANNPAPRQAGRPARPDEYRPEREEYRPEQRLRGAPPPRPPQAPSPLSSPDTSTKPSLDQMPGRLGGVMRPRPLTQVPPHWLTDPIPGEPSEGFTCAPPAPSGELPASRLDRPDDHDAPPSSKTGS